MKSKPLMIGALLAAALVLFAGGFGAGWYSFQASLANSLQDASAEIDKNLGAEAAPVEGEEPAPAGPPKATSKTDGIFEYTVTGTERADSFKDEWCGETYQPSGGEFVVVSLSAKNAGEATSQPAVSSGEVVAYDADGKSYETHMDICSFSDDVNPGNTTEYDVVFDVPKGTEFQVFQLTAAEASDVATIKAAT